MPYAPTAIVATVLTDMDTRLTTVEAGPYYGRLVGIGDSILSGQYADYAALSKLNFGTGVGITNQGVPGKRLSEMLTSVQGGSLNGLRNDAVPNVAMVEGGINDIFFDSTAATTLYGTATSLIAELKQRGWIVILTTLLPREDAGMTTAKRTIRTDYNTLVRANTGGADVILDWAADPVMGDAAGTSTSYYVDNVHPSTTGQDRLVVPTKPAIIAGFRKGLRYPTTIDPLVLDTPAYVTGKFGQAFAGAPGWARVPASTWSTNPTLPFTAELWVKMSGSAAGGPYVAMGATSNWWIGIQSTGYANASGGSSGGLQDVTSTTTLNDGNWHHLAVVFTLSGTRLYVDGVLAGQSATITYGHVAESQTDIGAFGGSFKWPGPWDDPTIWFGEKYTSNFTPPTAPPAIGATNLGFTYPVDGNGQGHR